MDTCTHMGTYLYTPTQRNPFIHTIKTRSKKKKKERLQGARAHSYTGSKEGETKRLLQFRDQIGLHSKFEASQSYMTSLFQEN